MLLFLRLFAEIHDLSWTGRPPLHPSKCLELSDCGSLLFLHAYPPRRWKPSSATYRLLKCGLGPTTHPMRTRLDLTSSPIRTRASTVCP